MRYGRSARLFLTAYGQMWAVFQQLHPHYSVNTTVLGQNVSISLAAPGSPEMLFAANGTSVQLSADLLVEDAAVGGRLVALVRAGLSVNITVNESLAVPSVTLQVGYEWLTANVSELHGLPITPGMVQPALAGFMQSVVIPQACEPWCQLRSLISVSRLTACWRCLLCLCRISRK